MEDTSLHAAGSRRGHAAEAGREGRAVAAAAAAARGGRCLRAALQEMGRRRKSAAPGRRRPFFPAGEAASGGAILRRGATPRKSRAWGGTRTQGPPRFRAGTRRPLGAAAGFCGPVAILFALSPRFKINSSMRKFDGGSAVSERCPPELGPQRFPKPMTRLHCCCPPLPGGLQRRGWLYPEEFTV